MERRTKNPLAGAETRTISSGVRPTEGLLSEPSAPTPEQNGTHPDYDLGQEISRGGMGRIVEAYDRRNDRQVALKLLLHRSESAVLRFKREAWITGRLQHPAIVPLYESGSLSTGEPFFAMKLVRGSSLADVIANSKTPAERLALLPHLIAVAEAIACAHAEGIVHRDLKPANILIGPYGETVVIDWGLAKRFDESSDDVPSTSIQSFPEGADALTAQGKVVGTPSYMAPEQARGEPLDARADVYALGATIFHALSGERPTASAIGASSVSTLSARAPHVPADLGTIVDKAMAANTADRYASAMDLAEDLRRFASGRLVAAHSYSIRELVGRWVGTHRAIVALGIISVIALITTGAISVRRIARERDRAEVARRDADDRGRTAIVQRDAAEKLVGSLVGDLRAQLVPLGKLDVMASLGEKVLEYYRSAASATTTLDAGTLLRRATAIETLAGVYHTQREFDKALNAYKQAIELCDSARTLDPNSIDSLLQRSTYQYRIANTEAGRFHLKEALVAIESSLASLASAEAYQHDPSKLPDLDSRTVEILNMKTLILRELGQLESARESAAGAIALLEPRAVEGAPQETLKTLGFSFFYAAGLEYLLGNTDAALEHATSALRLRERSLKLTPDNQYRKLDTSWSRARLGIVYAQAGRDSAARSELAAAIAGSSQLLVRDSSHALFRDALADALLELCRFEMTLGEFGAARVHCQAAVDAQEANASLAHDGTSADLSTRALANLSLCELGSGENALSVRTAKRAIEANDRPTSKSTDAALHDESRAAAHLALARAELADPALHDAAASDALTAVTEWDALLRASPKNVIRATQAIVAHIALADARIATNDAAAADESLETAAHTCDAVDPSVNVVDLRLACAEVDAKRAARMTDAAQATALRDHARAVLATVPPSRIRPIANERWLRDLSR